MAISEVNESKLNDEFKSDAVSIPLPDCNIKQDDVSRLNSRNISRIFTPRNDNDIHRILTLAIKNNKQVSVCGTSHSMGGHTIPPYNGYILDMKYFNNILRYDNKRDYVTVQSGITWEKVIKYLNDNHGTSPDILQSYCTFSVGGSIAVNAHGVTSDYCEYNSVIGFNCFIINGQKQIEKIYCGLDSNNNNNNNNNKKGKELYRLMIGGYGVFGIILDVTLKCKPNNLVIPKQIILTPNEFVDKYNKLLKQELKNKTINENVRIKLARINTQTWKNIYLTTFTTVGDNNNNNDSKSSEDRCKIELSENAVGLNHMEKLLYKWVANNREMQKLRFSLESKMDTPYDYPKTDKITCNLVLWQSAQPMGELYKSKIPLFGKLFAIDDTFILQEYFVPHKYFLQWYNGYADIFTKELYQRGDRNTKIFLLNTTIRYVFPDNVTMLPYAKSTDSSIDSGLFAFVLYYRIKADPTTDEILKKIHDKLVELTLNYSGTFYLPYRHHYSMKQLLKAYPNFTSFVLKKMEYDPNFLFNNLWFNDYGVKFINNNLGNQHNGYIKQMIIKSKIMSNRYSNTNANTNANTNTNANDVFYNQVNKVEEFRYNSYYNQLYKVKNGQQMYRDFLKHVLNIENGDYLFGKTKEIVDKAHKLHKNDLWIYNELQKELANRFLVKYIPIIPIASAWKGMKQLGKQKQVILHQMVNLVSKCGKYDTISSYLCLGDAGKLSKWLIQNLPKLKSNEAIFSMTDKTNNNANKVLADINTTIETGSVFKRWKKFCIDYRTLNMKNNNYNRHYNNSGDKGSGSGALSPIEEMIYDMGGYGKMELISSNGGFHHMTPDELHNKLIFIYNVLSDDGILLLREHDGINEYKAIIDVGHSLFNLLTKCDISIEKNEIRAYRSIDEWKVLLNKYGFIDLSLCELDETDPSKDYIIAFGKNRNFNGKQAFDKYKYNMINIKRKIDEINANKYQFADITKGIISGTANAMSVNKTKTTSNHASKNSNSTNSNSNSQKGYRFGNITRGVLGVNKNSGDASTGNQNRNSINNKNNQNNNGANKKTGQQGYKFGDVTKSVFGWK